MVVVPSFLSKGFGEFMRTDPNPMIFLIFMFLDPDIYILMEKSSTYWLFLENHFRDKLIFIRRESLLCLQYSRVVSLIGVHFSNGKKQLHLIKEE